MDPVAPAPAPERGSLSPERLHATLHATANAFNHVDLSKKPGHQADDSEYVEGAAEYWLEHASKWIPDDWWAMWPRR